MKDALDDFTDKVKNSAPPLSWRNVACFVACAPLISGTPLLYAACVLGCNGVVAGAGAGTDIVTASNELEAAEEAAKQSYCTCLAWKQANCNSTYWETDVVGCP